jgi:hypothetical protein
MRNVIINYFNIIECHCHKSDETSLEILSNHVNLIKQYLNHFLVIACNNNQLNIAKWLYSLEPNMVIKNGLFYGVCFRGHIDIVKWIYSLHDTDIHINNDQVFRVACQQGHIIIAKWLYSLNDVNINSNDDHAFQFAIIKGHLHICQWLYSLPNNNININVKKNYPFIMACKHGHFTIAKWLYSLSTNINTDKHCVPFTWAYIMNRLSICQWLYDIYADQIKSHMLIGAFKCACKEGYVNMAKWLYGLPCNDFSIDSPIYEQVCSYNNPNVIRWLRSLANN